VTLDGSIQKRIKRDNVIKMGIVLGLVVTSLIIILAVPGMLVSFILAFVISYLFKPIVSRLERKGIGRTLAVLIPFLISGVLISAASGIVIKRLNQQASSLQTDLPRYVNAATDLVKKKTSRLNATISPYTKIDMGERVGQWMQSSGENMLNKIPEWISTLLSTMILAPFFAFFMLRDGQRVSNGVLSMVPNSLFEIALNLSYQINKQLGGFIRARLFEGIIVGFVVGIGLYSLNFPYAVLLGIFAGLTNLIPYVGPIIGACPGILVAMVTNDTVASVALVSSIYIIAQLIDMLFVIPLLVAKIVDLHPVTVVIVIIIGSQVMGILGMIISVPAASIFKLIFTEFYNHVVDFRS
jgi:putative permease